MAEASDYLSWAGKFPEAIVEIKRGREAITTFFQNALPRAGREKFRDPFSRRMAE